MVHSKGSNLERFSVGALLNCFFIVFVYVIGKKIHSLERYHAIDPNVRRYRCYPHRPTSRRSRPAAVAGPGSGQVPTASSTSSRKVVLL